ncbi:rfaE bifunctional protein kinase chain/domain [Hypnocyclicus thermotrophus]|uniref:RfaE bifunctional protein kinase chain/domain n=1 Tax=Hypnocyclicus thermotrophus TaxID=1627895 RepID=A0AA46DYD2_9FUSO|nr:D-glycero-beta-D-manno-heptose-7-phosphate kinase [Hypnocyclicus thermotrophus]TDT69866.1 rfaE bifunctional protein kinase chain/domain [Hypnocyclicus thermotrophus]
MLKKERLFEILENFLTKSIAVIGDMMIDEYIIGNVDRISPEAPVPVVNVNNEKYVLGGAANVVNNLSVLGVNVLAYGIVGNDLNANKLLYKFKEKNVNTEGIIIDRERPTIIKQRILAGNQQLLRIDREKKYPISNEIENKIINNLNKNIEKIDAIILSDYDKGVLTENLAKNIIKIAKENNKIIIIDPKPKNVLNYIGATSMTPNLKEACECIGKNITENENEIIQIGKEIREKLELDHLLMTRSEKGMSIFMKNSVENIPTFAKEVYDVTGAGDTVISLYTLALSCGASYEESAKIANTGAGVVVGRVGTSVVTKEEIIEFYEEIYDKHNLKIEEKKY